MPLRILHLEDEPNDVELIRATLERDGLICEVDVATGREEFLAALERGNPELVLSDFALPGFDGPSALRIVREKIPEIPFILVSGTLGEEAASIACGRRRAPLSRTAGNASRLRFMAAPSGAVEESMAANEPEWGRRAAH